MSLRLLVAAWGVWAGASLWPAAPAAAQAPPDSVVRRLAARAIGLPPTLAALDSANGLGPFRFGTPVAELPEPLGGLTVLRHDKVTCVAPRPARVGQLLLPTISLTAYAGRLSRISLGPTTEQYAQVLLRTLQQLYGPGQRGGQLRRVWAGQVVTLVYEPLVTSRGGRYGTPHVQGTVYLQSNALLAEEQRAGRK